LRYLVLVRNAERKVSEGAATAAEPHPCAEPATAAPDQAAPDKVFVASHDILFAPDPETRCDACNRPLEPEGDADLAEGGGGEGVYLWARGDEVRFERVPLCADCAAAIGMTALARWEIEEEEG
jgi:hypothetical protein